jgi:hypothetical protein
MSAATSTVLKAEALRASKTLNPKPERVTDPLFHGSGFFDARDGVQVKYEMLRRVDREQLPVPTAARAFGLSRVTWYQVKAKYVTSGLVGLLPQRRGPQLHPPKQPRPLAASARLNWCNNMNSSETKR